MAFILDGITIRRPHTMQEANSTQIAVQRVLSGDITRDLFGSDKRVWTLAYTVVKKAAFDLINNIYQDYLINNIPKSWEITEPNNTIDVTTVHIDLQTRSFTIRGETMLSDFTLILTEK